MNAKRLALNLLLWLTFSFVAFSAGVRWDINPIAYIGMYVIVLTMILREYRIGLTEGAEIANVIWKAKMDELFEKLKNGNG